jgi:hypothetical protein
MYFLFSGEGATDCGEADFPDRICTGDQFRPGPMVLLADQIVEREDGYSPLDCACCGLVARPALNAAISDLKTNRKNPSLAGTHRPRETLHFRRSARALARLAKQWADENGDETVAIYFRDNDDHQSTPATLWKARIDAVHTGFEEEGLTRGVAMVPRPTSEAWLICALKERPYEHCDTLEERSGSPSAKGPLKKELAEHLGAEPTRDLICGLVAAGKIDASRIGMPSFEAFREDLRSAIA